MGIVRKKLLLEVLLITSKLCKLIYNKTDRTALEFCVLNNSGIKDKSTASSQKALSCPNLRKVTVITSNNAVKEYSFSYLHSLEELIIVLNSTCITKEQLSQMTDLKKNCKKSEFLHEFYLNLLHIIIHIFQSKQAVIEHFKDGSQKTTFEIETKKILSSELEEFNTTKQKLTGKNLIIKSN